MRVLGGAEWRDGIKNNCGMRYSRSLYLTIDFVCHLEPEATYVRRTEQLLRVNEKKKNATWEQVY